MRWSKWKGKYDRAIWVRVIGTALGAFSNFMIRPFLVLYLYDQLGGSVILPMIIVGLQPLAGMAAGYYGGHWADKYGRKPIMVLSLVAQAATMAGFAFAESVWAFAVLSVLSGLSSALFYPAANAQIADIVPKDQQAEVYALIHAALNFGAAMGPAVGLLMFGVSADLVFGIAAATSLMYMVMLIRYVPETKPASDDGDRAGQGGQRIALRELSGLIWITALAVPINFLYAQVETTLPLHLETNFENYRGVLTTLVTFNGLVVLALQVWIAKRTEMMSSASVIGISYGLLAVVAVGYGFAPTLLMLLCAEFVFTIGEMLIGPHFNKTISQIAPEQMRGRYFSIFTMNWQIGRAFGPILGGLMLSGLGGEGMFLIWAGLLALSGVFQYLVIRVVLQRKQGVLLADAQPGATGAV